jgi:hypothetical protein
LALSSVKNPRASKLFFSHEREGEWASLFKARFNGAATWQTPLIPSPRDKGVGRGTGRRAIKNIIGQLLHARLFQSFTA